MSADPAASCLFMDFDASSARFALRYWLQRLDLDDSTDSVVRCEIHRALLAAGITPAVPRRVPRERDETSWQLRAARATLVAVCEVLWARTTRCASALRPHCVRRAERHNGS